MSSTAIAKFPVKLHFMLNEMRNDGLNEIASWQPSGKSFKVKNIKEFETQILRWFSSFQRQLNFYGFKRITEEGIDKGAYQHACFLQKEPELAYTIQRIPRKTMAFKTQCRKPFFIDTEKEAEYSHGQSMKDLAFSRSQNDFNKLLPSLQLKGSLLRTGTFEVVQGLLDC